MPGALAPFETRLAELRGLFDTLRVSNFEGAMQSILAQLKTLMFANQKLRAARDLLLPRLMSGALAV